MKTSVDVLDDILHSLTANAESDKPFADVGSGPTPTSLRDKFLSRHDKISSRAMWTQKRSAEVHEPNNFRRGDRLPLPSGAAPFRPSRTR
jgi:hypothetical protein